MNTLHAIANWIYHILGFKGSGSWYGMWSGWGSDLGEVTLIGMLWAGLRHVNCHVKGCPRMGKHPVQGTPYKVCRKHHPGMSDDAPSHADVIEAHRAASIRGDDSGNIEG